jgi:AbrB family looped-hinge helix DNA binding protein
MPVVRVKRKFQVTIPAEVRKRLGLAEGDYLEVTEEDSHIVLKPKVVLDKPDEETLAQLEAILERIRQPGEVSEEEVEKDVLEAIRTVRRDARARRRS